MSLYQSKNGVKLHDRGKRRPAALVFQGCARKPGSAAAVAECVSVFWPIERQRLLVTTGIPCASRGAGGVVGAFPCVVNTSWGVLVLWFAEGIFGFGRGVLGKSLRLGGKLPVSG
jgi:hypothetical protein